MQYLEFSTTSAAFINGMAQAVVNDVNSRRRATDEDCRCGGKFWTMYVFYIDLCVFEIAFRCFI